MSALQVGRIAHWEEGGECKMKWGKERGACKRRGGGGAWGLTRIRWSRLVGIEVAERRVEAWGGWVAYDTNICPSCCVVAPV